MQPEQPPHTAPWQDEWFGVVLLQTTDGSLTLWSHNDASNRLRYRVCRTIQGEHFLAFESESHEAAAAEMRRLARQTGARVY